MQYMIIRRGVINERANNILTIVDEGERLIIGEGEGEQRDVEPCREEQDGDGWEITTIQQELPFLHYIMVLGRHLSTTLRLQRPSL